MKRDNKTQYALLGVLTQFEGTGYDIKKFIETSIGYFWQESYGQIYPNLKKMEKEGLISSHRIAESKGTAKINYAITPTGRQKLLDWLRLPVENANYRNELLLKLFFGSQMNSRDITDHLTTRRIALENTLNAYRAIEKNLQSDDCNSPELPYWRITLNYGISTTKAELEWILAVDENIKKNDVNLKF